MASIYVRPLLTSDENDQRSNCEAGIVAVIQKLAMRSNWRKIAFVVQRRRLKAKPKAEAGNDSNYLQ